MDVGTLCRGVESETIPADQGLSAANDETELLDIGVFNMEGRENKI